MTRLKRVKALETAKKRPQLRLWWQDEHDPHIYRSEGHTVTGRPPSIRGVVNVVVEYGVPSSPES